MQRVSYIHYPFSLPLQQQNHDMGGMFPNQDRGGGGLVSRKDPPEGLMYSPRHAWGSTGDLRLIDHPLSLLPSSLTWV